jgi:hypothetical protein
VDDSRNCFTGHNIALKQSGSGGDRVSQSAMALQKAQRCIGVAMGTCLALWYAPWVSGLAVNKAESAMVALILKSLNCYSVEAVDSVFWFVRKKMLLVDFLSYTPYAGVPLQLFETYALGQFTLHCTAMPERLRDENWMAQNWKEIEAVVFSGRKAVQSYEQFTGQVFPEFARPTFLKVVDIISSAYRTAEKVPGLSWAQEKFGESIRIGIRGGKVTVRQIVSEFARTKKKLPGDLAKKLE